MRGGVALRVVYEALGAVERAEVPDPISPRKPSRCCIGVDEHPTDGIEHLGRSTACVIGDPVDLDGVGDISEQRRAERDGGEVSELGEERGDGVAREELTDIGVGGEPCSDVHRRAEAVIVALDNGAMVDADAHAGELWFALDGVEQIQSNLQPMARVRRHDHHRVADRLDQPRVASEQLGGEVEESLRDVGGTDVAVRVRERGVAGEVSEANGPARLCLWCGHLEVAGSASKLNIMPL
jgi:hypothetical protein